MLDTMSTTLLCLVHHTTHWLMFSSYDIFL